VSSRRLGGAWQVLLLAACLTAALLLVACGGSGKPSYCSKVDDLKKSVSDLANVKVVQNGTSSVKTAFDKVQSNANAVIDALKSDFPNETSALSSSVDSLSNSVKQLTSSPATALPAIPGEVSAVSTGAKNLANATQSKCS
jgi:phage-related protein